MDNDENLYVLDEDKNEVRRWKLRRRSGTVVAGENQFNSPSFMVVDQNLTFSYL